LGTGGSRTISNGFVKTVRIKEGRETSFGVHYGCHGFVTDVFLI